MWISYCRVCIALYKLASCAEYSKVATTFGVSVTSVHRHLYSFCNAMTSKKHTLITWYTNEDGARIADITRANYKYPQAIGMTTIDYYYYYEVSNWGVVTV